MGERWERLTPSAAGGLGCAAACLLFGLWYASGPSEPEYDLAAAIFGCVLGSLGVYLGRKAHLRGSRWGVAVSAINCFLLFFYLGAVAMALFLLTKVDVLPAR